MVEALGFVMKVVVVGWLWSWLEDWFCLALGMWSVALLEGILFVELVKVEDDWLWCSDMIGNKLELGLGYFRRLAVERVNGKIESIGGGGGPIAWYGWLLWIPIADLLRRLFGVLLHFSFRLKEYEAIFYVVVGFTIVVYTVRGTKCVWGLVATATMI
jgi:hypothetical protein